MTDPVAEAAAQIAAQQAEPSMLAKAMDTIHDLEAKVEHLIHPESVPNVMPESPAIDASATLSGSLGQSGEIVSSVKPSESLPTEALEPASPIASSEPSTTILTSSAGSESPNAVPVASEATSGATVSATALANEGSDLPNVLPASTSGIAEESTPSADSGLTADLPNAATGVAALPAIVASALGASIPAGIPGIVANSTAEPVKLASDATSAIKVGIANIKHHLSIRGFEQSAVADIHAELEAIEKWL